MLHTFCEDVQALKHHEGECSEIIVTFFIATTRRAHIFARVSFDIDRTMFARARAVGGARFPRFLFLRSFCGALWDGGERAILSYGDVFRGRGEV